MRNHRHVGAALLGLVLALAVTMRPSSQQPATRSSYRAEPVFNRVESLVWTPDGKHYLVKCSGSFLALRELETGKKVWQDDSDTMHPYCPALSPHGGRGLSLTRTGDLRFWDARTGQTLRTWPAHPACQVNALAFSHDGRRALSCSGRGGFEIRLWDLSRGKMLRHFDEGHLGDITHVVFSRDDCFALSGSLDHTVRLWDVSTGEELLCCKGPATADPLFVAFSPDGHRALASCRRHVCLWDLKTAKLIWSIGNPFVLPQAAFMPDGRSVLTASFQPHPDNREGVQPCRGTLSVVVRDAVTGKEQRRHAAPPEKTPAAWAHAHLVAFHPDGKDVLIGDSEGCVRRWTLPR
jgi:WD40 repeat protein